METLTKQEVLGIVETYIESLKDCEKRKKDACQRAWYVITHIIMPLGKKFPDDIDASFIIQALKERGIDKDEGEHQIPFHTLPTKKQEDPRDTCPECDIVGNLGCPQHREIVRNLST